MMRQVGWFSLMTPHPVPPQHSLWVPLPFSGGDWIPGGLTIIGFPSRSIHLARTVQDFLPDHSKQATTNILTQVLPRTNPSKMTKINSDLGDTYQLYYLYYDLPGWSDIIIYGCFKDTDIWMFPKIGVGPQNGW